MTIIQAYQPFFVTFSKIFPDHPTGRECGAYILHMLHIPLGCVSQYPTVAVYYTTTIGYKIAL